MKRKISIGLLVLTIPILFMGCADKEKEEIIDSIIVDVDTDTDTILADEETNIILEEESETIDEGIEETNTDNNFIIKYYNKGDIVEKSNLELKNKIIQSLEESNDMYMLSILEEELDAIYEESEFIKLKLNETKSIDTNIQKNIKVDEILVILKNDVSLYTGMVMTRNEDENDKFWAIDDNIFTNIKELVQD